MTSVYGLPNLKFGFFACLKIDFGGFGFSSFTCSFVTGVTTSSFLFFKASSLFLVADDIFLLAAIGVESEAF